MLVAQSCLTLCHPMDSSPPASYVQEILQSRVLEWVWVTIPFPRESFWPRGSVLQVDSLPSEQPRKPKESWAPKNWYLQIVVLGKILESPSVSKEIKPLNPKRNEAWIFIGRTEAEAEVPICWPPDVKTWLTGKDPDAGKDWGQEEKGVVEGEMVR